MKDFDSAITAASRHHADIDAEGIWDRLADRAEAAGYPRSTVLRHRGSRAMTSTNIGAAYQQGWWDCIAFITERAPQHPPLRPEFGWAPEGDASDVRASLSPDPGTAERWVRQCVELSGGSVFEREVTEWRQEP